MPKYQQGQYYKYSIGDTATITRNLYGHGYEPGQQVRIVTQYMDSHDGKFYYEVTAPADFCFMGLTNWHVTEEEIE